MDSDRQESTPPAGGNLVRTKPCLEIYRPPSLRKDKKDEKFSSRGFSGKSLKTKQPNGSYQTSKTNNSDRNSQDSNSSESLEFNNDSNADEALFQQPCKFNINAKEFCYQSKTNGNDTKRIPGTATANIDVVDSTHAFQTVEQQLRAKRQTTAEYSPSFRAYKENSGLSQSKSLGNVSHLFRAQIKDLGEEVQHKKCPVATPAANSIYQPVAILPTTAQTPKDVKRPGILTSTFLKNMSAQRNETGQNPIGGTSKILQSKSSGSIHKVRFLDEDDDDDDDEAVEKDKTDLAMMNKKLRALQLNAGALNPKLTSSNNDTEMQQDATTGQQLQKSKTMPFVPLNFMRTSVKSDASLMGQVPLTRKFPTPSNYYSTSNQNNPWHYYMNLQQQQQRGPVAPVPLVVAPSIPLRQYFTANVALSNNNPNFPNSVKRSKSFTSASNPKSMLNAAGNNPNNNALLHSKGNNFYSQSLCPSFMDFQLNKWPKNVQEVITTVVTGIDQNTTGKHKIDMVAQIFNVLFSINERSNEPLSSQMKTWDLIGPAVNIFIYFLLKEQNVTIAESLVNTSFATFQLFVQKCKEITSGNNVSSVQNLINNWNKFLKFISTIYSQIKVIRVQQPQRKKTIDEMGSTFLSLLCDACLATLCINANLITPETMDHLFMTMTSVGRDMETTFPMKMKQILTAVRDVLLGVGPLNNNSATLSANTNNNKVQCNSNANTSHNFFARSSANSFSSQNNFSSHVQKTLMQLIELHAANWNLPASAVRYYYNNT